MNVLVTGASGRVGTAIYDHLAEREMYSFTCVDVEPAPDQDTNIVDVTEEAKLRQYVQGQDAIVHLAWPSALTPWTDSTEWNRALAAHLEGICNAISLAVSEDIDTFVFASSNHAVGMYEREYAPALYEPNHPLCLDHESNVRPDSLYGVAKLFGENVLRLAAEVHDVSGYALRIGAVREPAYDHPYGSAEQAVESGKVERGSPEYNERVKRMKALWQSRRDLAALVDCCLQNDTVSFDIFYGVSKNAGRWFDIDNARETVGYEPLDDGSKWSAPP